MQLQILLLTLYMAEVSLKNHFRPGKWSGRIAMVWIDGRNRDHVSVDTFYDRIISIAITKPGVTRQTLEEDKIFTNEVTGVFITSMLILTSFNAFRTVASQKDTMNRIRISALNTRVFFENGTLRTYHARVPNAKVICGRQVIPAFHNESVLSHMRHGRHSPVHDLMVLRLNKKVEFLKPIPEPMNSFPDPKQGTYNSNTKLYNVKVGPIQTDLARPEDEIVVEDLKFASVGYLSDKHIKESRYLEREEVYSDDNVITNCDEWMPRNWGYFICLKNVYNYPGIASGALLFSEGKLFGVGSFALWKGGKGIFAFTDIRPYWHLLHRTCTTSDQNLEIPDD